MIRILRRWDWNATNQFAADWFYNDNKDNYYTVEESYSASGVNYLLNNAGWKDWLPAEELANVEAALANES